MGDLTVPGDRPITSRDDLLNIFRAAEKPEEKFAIGAEMEKPGIDRTTAAAIPYEGGEQNVLGVLKDLVTTFGWRAEGERPDGPIIALLRGTTSITLEPGGQLELSGAALTDIHQVCIEFRKHLAEITPSSTEMNIRWLGIGFHPLAKREDLPWVPKDRYKIMREYLPTRGKYGLDMMLRTSTVQANYDYTGEVDAMRKLKVSLKLAPLTTAIFANSPWVEGKPHGGPSYRAKVWLDVDNARAGLVENVWKDGAKYEDYVEWALDAGMFLVKHDGKIFPNTGQTFRSFLKDGFQGEKALLSDWQTHLNTLFPEVRLKRTIEVRGADAQSSRLACALPALWTGIFYDQKALAEAEEMTRDWTYAEVKASRAFIGERGLATPFRNGTFRELAERMFEISEGGLARRARKSASGKDERYHLQALKALVEKGQTPGDALLAEVDPKRPLAEQIPVLADISSPTRSLAATSIPPPPGE